MKRKNKEIKIYIAAPFFNSEQFNRVERIKHILDKRGYIYFSPKDEIMLHQDSSIDEQEECFQGNCHAILTSDFVLAVTDGKDMGTVWEAGFAFGHYIPIVYFAETLGNNQFNVMLARSGIGVLRSMDELEAYEFLGTTSFTEYTGPIE